MPVIRHCRKIQLLFPINPCVEDGRFTLFEAGDIEELAEGAGFAPVHGDFPVYLYRKPKRSWFHFGR